MGCNMRGAIEVRQYGLWWYGANLLPFERRNYRFFAKLAGVRNEDYGITPIAPDRGIPEDASDETKWLSDSADYHHHTWLSYDEWRGAEVWKDMNPLWLAFIRVLRLYAKTFGAENIRVIIWFDG